MGYGLAVVRAGSVSQPAVHKRRLSANCSILRIQIIKLIKLINLFLKFSTTVCVHV